MIEQVHLQTLGLKLNISTLRASYRYLFVAHLNAHALGVQNGQSRPTTPLLRTVLKPCKLPIGLISPIRNLQEIEGRINHTNRHAVEISSRRPIEG